MKEDNSYRDKVRCSMRALMKTSEDGVLVRQLLMALCVLIFVTLFAAAWLLLTEGRGGDAVFGNYWNCVFWTLMSYLGNPAGVGEWAVVTSGGRVVAVIVQIISIAFFAAFTGLLVAFITARYGAIHHKAKLERTHRDLLRAFHRQFSRNLSKEFGKSTYIVPSQQLLASLKLKANIDLDDAVEVSCRYYGFRVKNLANIRSIEDEGVTDRFIVEHFPVNRSYGCCLDRGSNVTIVSPSSDRSVGIGWFSYYLAHFGAFNYISRDYAPDPLNRKSFYNRLDPIPEAAATLYNDFLRDLTSFSQRENAWAIFVLAHTKSKSDCTDIQISFSKNNGQEPTVKDPQSVLTLGGQLRSSLPSLSIQVPSSRYPLSGNNIVYVNKSELGKSNSFTLRIAYGILKADTERLLIADKIAMTIAGSLSAISSQEIHDTLQDDISNYETDTYNEKDWIGEV